MNRNYANPYGGNTSSQRFRSPGGSPRGQRPQFNSLQSQPPYQNQHDHDQHRQRMDNLTSTPAQYPSPRGNLYQSGSPANYWGNSPNYSPQYTPSPIRSRPQRPFNRSFDHNRPGRWRGGYNTPNQRHGSRPKFQEMGDIPIDKFFSENMLRDPWLGLKPYPMKKSRFTTT